MSIKNIIKNHILFLIIAIITFHKCLTYFPRYRLKVLNKFVRMELVIKGSGEKQILSNDFELPPYPIIFKVNDEDDNITDYYNYYTDNLTEEINNITLQWNDSIVNFSNMFNGISDILQINITIVDVSNLINMNKMFYECISLESIELNLKNISSSINMSFMFYNCKNLISFI